MSRSLDFAQLQGIDRLVVRQHIGDSGGQTPESNRARTSGSDPSIEAEHQQLQRWRGMTPDEKLLLATSMSQAVDQLALAGIVRRYPDASPREQFLRLAALRLGRSLAVQVDPEIVDLDGT